MAVVLLAAFLMIACLLALRFEKQLTAVLPLATCILILILYVLAFFRRLSWIDYFSTAIVVGAVLRVLFLSGEKAVCTAAGAVLCAVCDCCHGVADRCSASDRK